MNHPRSALLAIALGTVTLLSTTGTRQASAAPAVRYGTMHALAPNFYGVNIEDAFVEHFLWEDAHTATTIQADGFRSLRFPGGDFSSYYDWRTGWIWPNFLRDPLVAGAIRLPRGADSIANFAALAKITNTYPVYALNVLTRAADPVDEPLDADPPGALLSPTISPQALAAAQREQIDLLEAATNRYGLGSPYVELGNELFWDTRQDAVADNVRAYPNGAEYGDAMTSWASALHGRFGKGIAIAAVGAIPPGGVTAIPARETERIRNWNPGVFDRAKGIDALTLHRYDEATWDRVPQDVLALAFRDWAAIQSGALAAVAEHGFGAWFTEFGGFSDYTGYLRSDGSWRIKPAYTGTWLRGLYDAQVLLQFLSDSRVGQIDFYNLSDAFFQTPHQSYYVAGNVPPNAPPGLTGGTIVLDNARGGGLTTIGQAYALIGRGVAGATVARALTFGGTPVVHAPNGAVYPAVTAVQLDGISHRVLVLNLSESECNIPWRGPVTLESLWSPHLMTVVDSDTSLRHTVVRSSGKSQISLPPYSVNVLE